MLKVRGGVEQGKRYPRKACKKMLTSLLKTGLGDGHSRRTDSAAGGGQHIGLPEEAILQGRVVATCSYYQKSKKRNSRECQHPCKGWEKLASSGKWDDSGGLEGSMWLVGGMKWDRSREQRWDPEL